MLKTTPFIILSALYMLSGRTVLGHDGAADTVDTTGSIIRTACDPNVPNELREFKQRQIQRRQAYLDGAMKEMQADAEASGSLYSIEDRRDFKETLGRMETESAELKVFLANGCSVQSPRQITTPEPSFASGASVRAASFKSAPDKQPQQSPQVPAAPPGPAEVASSKDPKKIDTPSKGSDPNPKPAATDIKPAGDADITALSNRVKTIETALSTQNHDFGLVLGVGSMVINPHVSDYKNDSNVLHTTNLGSSTPQLLTGVSFRSHLPSLTRRFRSLTLGCKDLAQPKCGEDWQVRPWSGFVSLKFAPGASQLLNGYVIGGTYAITKYLDALIGFSMTPVNEPSPGFRVSASQFVVEQQKLGLDLNFNPTAMLQNKRDAFDGFPVTDSTGKLIYPGDPLTVHYRAGIVFGVSFSRFFGSSFKPSSGTN